MTWETVSRVSSSDSLCRDYAKRETVTRAKICLEGLVPARAWGFKSPLRHCRSGDSSRMFHGLKHRAISAAWNRRGIASRRLGVRVAQHFHQLRVGGALAR